MQKELSQSRQLRFLCILKFFEAYQHTTAFGVIATQTPTGVDPYGDLGKLFPEQFLQLQGGIPVAAMGDHIEMLVKKFEGRMLAGAGTVIRENQVELTRAAGGTFIISPDTCQRIIEKTRELDMVSMPGALTPTEIAAAHSYGADFVKLFPVNVFGVDYVKAVKAPLSHVKLLAVGGVDENNIADYLKAGAVGFGIGSGVVKKCLIDANDFDGVCALAEKYTKAIGK